MLPSAIVWVLYVASAIILGAPITASNSCWQLSHISPRVGNVRGQRASTSEFHHFNTYRPSRASFFSQEAFPSCETPPCAIHDVGHFLSGKLTSQYRRKSVGTTTNTAVGVTLFVGTTRASVHDKKLVLPRKVQSPYLDPFHVTPPIQISGKSPSVCSASNAEDKTPFFDSSSSVLYFAYGANMSPAILTQKRGVRPRVSLPAEAVSVLDWQLPNGSMTASGSCRTLHRESDAGVCLCFSHRSGV